MSNEVTAEPPIGYLIVNGDPVDGFQFTVGGRTVEEAAIAGEQFDGDWWIAPLYAPAGLADFTRNGLPRMTEDQSLLNSPEGTGEQTRRLGTWLATNLGLPDRLTSEDVDEAIRVLSNSSVPEALEEIRSVS